MNKYEIKLTMWIIGGIFGALFVGYLFMSTIGWLFTDPLNIVPDTKPLPNIKNPDIIKCREIGGYPIQSKWDGDLLECKKLELN